MSEAAPLSCCSCRVMQRPSSWACSRRPRRGLLGSFAVLRQLFLHLAMALALVRCWESLSASCWAQSHPGVYPFAVSSPCCESVVERSRLPTVPLLNIFVIFSSLSVAWVALSFVRTYAAATFRACYSADSRLSWLDLGSVRPCCSRPGLSAPHPPRTRSCSPSMNRSPCSRGVGRSRFVVCCSILFCWPWWWRSRSRPWGALISAFCGDPACCLPVGEQPTSIPTCLLASGLGPVSCGLLGPCCSRGLEPAVRACVW